tara:strand:+ start:2148 stop:2756 length:609 start_codon:yes stop_codon:yes gene_type:complete
MWAKVKADQVIEVFSGAKAITDSNGVQHPSSIFSNWSKDELKNIGIYAVSMATPPDNRFYKGGTPSYSFSKDKVIETINETPHELADVTVTDSDNKVMKNLDGTTMMTTGLITQYKMDIDNRAYNMLQPSDWMAVRQYEAGVSITDDWKTYRAGVRTKAAEMKTAVSAVTSVGALKDLHVVYDTDNSIASGILYNFGEPPSE